MPHVDAIDAALEAAYGARDDKELRASAVEWAQEYHIDNVMSTHWLAILDQFSKPREVAPLNGNRAQRRAAAKIKAKA
jgi:hypothetical protein